MKGIIVKIDFSPPKEPSTWEELTHREYGECRCGRPGVADHSCPHSGDLHGDYETKCNCCDVCENACADDI